MIEKLDRREILRYLGYRDAGVTERIEALLDRCERETLEILRPKYIYRRFPIEVCEGAVKVSGSSLILKGRAICEHLKNCREIFILAATAGIGLDRRIRKYMVIEPDAGVVMDSCGIQAVEQIADAAEGEMAAQADAEGLHLTWRFSPGYGDLPLETQRELVWLLDTHRKIGLSLTESCLMVPGKSVTAILGISDTRRDMRPNKCDFCNNRNSCEYRKKDRKC